MSEKRFRNLKEVDEYLEKQIQNEKRFEMSDNSTVYRYSIIDKKKGVLKVNECVVLLNKLNDENEQLQQVISENEKLLGNDFDMLTDLRRENEQLKRKLRITSQLRNIRQQLTRGDE